MQFEILYQELVHGAEIIHALAMGWTQAEAQIKPDPEPWSILEVLCHLHDIDPGTWVESREYNKRNFTETLNSFLEERNKSLAWLKNLSTPNWESEHTDQYGSIKAGEMFSAWVDHDNLHIRQLVELRQARIVRLAEPYDVSYAGEW